MLGRCRGNKTAQQSDSPGACAPGGERSWRWEGCSPQARALAFTADPHAAQNTCTWAPLLNVSEARNSPGVLHPSPSRLWFREEKQRHVHREGFLHEDEVHRDQQRPNCQPQVSHLEGRTSGVGGRPRGGPPSPPAPRLTLRGSSPGLALHRPGEGLQQLLTSQQPQRLQGAPALLPHHHV